MLQAVRQWLDRWARRGRPLQPAQELTLVEAARRLPTPWLCGPEGMMRWRAELAMGVDADANRERLEAVRQVLQERETNRPTETSTPTAKGARP